MDEGYTLIFPNHHVSGLFDTLILIGSALFVATVMSRAYIWVVAKSHGQTMDEYMQGLAESTKKRADEK